jgi:hypothetical protein
MSDARVAFLIWFIVIAIVIAAGLIFIEIRLKKKRVREAVKKKEETPVDRMKVFLAGDASIREKLDVVGTTAKTYFKDEYGLSRSLDYGELAREFKGRGQVLESEFCEKMFEAYYSNHKVTNKKLKDLGKMVAGIQRRKNVSERMDRMDIIFEHIRTIVMKELKKYSRARRERLLRKARVAAREDHELLSWVRKAIRMGYDETKVSSLLNDGKRSKRKVKKVLKVYGKEAVGLTKKKKHARLYSGGGVARRIVEKEKNLLEGDGAYVR